MISFQICFEESKTKERLYDIDDRIIFFIFVVTKMIIYKFKTLLVI
jgi:hypothetical protein